MGLGDELIAAGEAQVAYDRDPSRRVAIVDNQGRPRWHELWEGNPIIATPAQVAAGESVQTVHNCPGHRPYTHEFTYQSGWNWTTDWRANDHRGRLYLTAMERALGRMVRAQFGGFIAIEPSPKKISNINKQWIPGRWRDLVQLLMGQRRVVVQLMHEDSSLADGAVPIHAGSFRRACAVLEQADLFIGTEGGLHHAAAVLRRPAVVIFGGCASVYATGYDDHVNLADAGPDSPCGRYVPCDHCRDAMARIFVSDVIEAMPRALSAQQVPA